MEPADIQPPRTLQLQNNLEQEDPQFSARVLEQLRFHLYGAAIEDVKIIIITSRDSPPSASFHCYGTPLTTFPRRHFHDGDSTVTILVDINKVAMSLYDIRYHDAGTMHASSHCF